VIGIILKQSICKSTRVKELCDRISVDPRVGIPFSNEGLYLTDHTATIKLDLSQQVQLRFDQIVTGVPVAILGLCQMGQIIVTEVCYATPETPEFPLSQLPTNMDTVRKPVLKA